MDAVGRASLVLALLVAVYGVGASIYGARAGRREWVTSGRRAVYAVFALSAVAFAVNRVFAFIEKKVQIPGFIVAGGTGGGH